MSDATNYNGEQDFWIAFGTFPEFRYRVETDEPELARAYGAIREEPWGYNYGPTPDAHFDRGAGDGFGAYGRPQGFGSLDGSGAGWEDDE